ncbi:MAG TPA: hypothetical protein VM840_07710 [Actinomycetota bacterium]|nr:hypothetical protein [Actinomycetota bacterium]
MTQRRKAESPKARAWHGDAAAANRLDEDRRWVVWGTGPREVDVLRTARQGDDIAEGIVRGRDPEWADSDDPLRWVVVLDADEDDVDAWVQEDPAAAGYAAHLIAPSSDERPAELVQQDVEKGEPAPLPPKASKPRAKSASGGSKAARSNGGERPGPAGGEETGGATGREPARDEETAGLLARMLDALPIGPRSEIYEGELKVFAGADLPDVPLFAEAGPHRLVARLTHTAELPVPQFLALAVKVPDIYGAGRDQDILMFSSLPAPVGHHVVAPALGFERATFSTLLPHRVGGQRLLFGAVGTRSPREEGLTFRLVVAPPVGGWRDAGVLYLRTKVEDAADAPRFDPWTTGGSIAPTGTVNRVRRMVKAAVRTVR